MLIRWLEEKGGFLGGSDDNSSGTLVIDGRGFTVKSGQRVHLKPRQYQLSIKSEQDNVRESEAIRIALDAEGYGAKQAKNAGSPLTHQERLPAVTRA